MGLLFGNIAGLKVCTFIYALIYTVTYTIYTPSLGPPGCCVGSLTEQRILLNGFQINLNYF
ncbi:hypothetical protein Dfer_0125 [Dyadobacter fermentans DSM 18053]|uniref:Uncharacterized protein n=1 Tax=Dyadobacter fermentans (strain ATCC 700827 / DSM 18053 / CIP 107007 / KCTC 52180 / NS114) TaxID=471854 RepID=C6VVU0_DYAFD|nr:hypothetical protein Dfer_0125 [Dyadobacter fermentans DSM 18053]